MHGYAVLSVRLLCAAVRLWSLSCGNWRPSRHCSRWISSRLSCPTPSPSAEVNTTASLFLTSTLPPPTLSSFLSVHPFLLASQSSSPSLPPLPLPSPVHLYVQKPPTLHVSVDTGDYDAIQVLMLLPRIVFKADLVTDQLKQQVYMHMYYSVNALLEQYVLFFSGEYFHFTRFPDFFLN